MGAILTRYGAQIARALKYHLHLHLDWTQDANIDALLSIINPDKECVRISNCTPWLR